MYTYDCGIYRYYVEVVFIVFIYYNLYEYSLPEMLLFYPKNARDILL